MTSFELILCALLVFVSGFLSSSEIALFSLSRFQLRALREHLRPAAHRKIKKLLSDPGGLLITILVINEIVNIALSAMIAHAVSGQGLGTRLTIGKITSWVLEAIVGTLITAPIVVFFCEITPKVIGAQANQLVAGLSVEPLAFTYELARPVRVALRGLVNWLARWFGGPKPQPETEGILKESDFILMVEEGHREGAIHESELGLIKKVFELDNTTVSDIYKPIAQVQTLGPQTQLKNALQLIRAQSYSRIPVLSSSKKVVGILYLKDLLRARMNPEKLMDTVSTVMRKPLTVHPTLRLNSLFRRFKQERTHMAVVQAESGEVMGIVTMADVLEALFEDLLAEEETPKKGKDR